MRRLPDNLVPAMKPLCFYSMFSAEQCPKALAWMAALCASTGRGHDAEQWLIELIESVLFTHQNVVRPTEIALRDTASMS